MAGRTGLRGTARRIWAAVHGVKVVEATVRAVMM